MSSFTPALDNILDKNLLDSIFVLVFCGMCDRLFQHSEPYEVKPHRQ